jgi:ATP synthase protein I
MAQGYRFVGEVVGGVLGGVGLGWLLDRFAHTQPWGVVGGLLIGTGISIFAAVSTAAKANKKALDAIGPMAPAPADEDED